MADIQALKSAIDELSPRELDEMYKYIEQRRQRTWWVVPHENLKQIQEVMRPVHEEAAQMTEEEINAAIDEAIDEVRRERKARRSD
jgi:7,8-dihydro-6-hydroxymethylpterin-pyrophosphokinase